MSKVSISGYGDSLTVNGICIGELSPDEHESIEKEKGGQNYAPLENVVISRVKDSSTLNASTHDPQDNNKYNQSEIPTVQSIQMKQSKEWYEVQL